jgi:hypothetical protein
MSEQEHAGKREAPDLAAEERRRAPRHSCDLAPFWADWGIGGGELPDARVLNISTTGLCLATTGRVRPGSVVVLKLLSEAHSLSRPLLVRIIHSTQQGDGGWHSGGSFVRRLTDQELEAILASGRRE